ncbi:MAG: insulinase family protein [Candidatus Pacebacteria bacterium]|jgi:predicted Zn-dependent peptidase|nr:insulinase family protein [Candidatus Paceibacterota bacterium]MBT4005099.1 insulinase family protein [Candidatus Paceibacterota bacterium]MBT4358920.1 insulinase family protein [Candidatus Paceibacterota bacterium]MBT4680789.1 insulinase family protein [Candidatus Paceibacterota bacterium]MBT6898780.1 insulinase family protein [Candidatus Paceibacterota bacterium]
MFAHNFQILANGLPVLRVPMPGVESVTVLALANTGSRYEDPQQQGIAHFFEHMVFKGSQNYPTAQSLAMTVDGVGADFNAFTSKEYTGYYVKAASRHFELALDVVSDMLMTPKLRQEDIDREKGVIIEEIHMYEDSPSQYVGNLFDRMAFNGSGLGHDIIGSEKTVSELTSADFTGFLKQWYGLPNLLLVIAGDESVVGSDDVLEQAEAAFSKQDPQTADRITQKVAVREDLTKNPFSKQLLHLEHKATEQAHFILGWPSPDRLSEDRYALAMLNIALGANMSSRLFTEVREKRGLAYYVGSSIDANHDSGLFGAAVGADPKRIEEALEVTIQEFMQLTDGAAGVPITEGELARAKEYVAGKMALSYENPQAIAQYYGMKQLLTDKIETIDEVLVKLKAVTLEEIQDVVDKIIKPGEMRLALIGPFADEDKFKKYLG